MKGKNLQQTIYRMIQDNWPIHVRETVSLLNWDPMEISNVTKVRYHFLELQKRELIRTKRIGRALVAWPTEMEKLRMIHELLRE